MPITIKRYRNRKLYNTKTKRYITLDQISDLIKGREEIKVIENGTGKDITAATLSQIIFEGEKNDSGLLPTSLLFSLVQSGGERIEEIRRNIFETLNLSHHYDVEIERRVSWLINQGELNPEDGAQILKILLRAGSRRDEVLEGIESRIEEFLQQRQILTRNDFSNLLQKIDNLSMRVDAIKDKQIEPESSG